MNISEIAAKLLTNFSPEERSIPDSATYPGRNAAVMAAMNSALQDLFGKGKPWMRRDDKGVVLNPPITIPITVTNKSDSALLDASVWEDWFLGCSIVIEGADVDNRIKATAAPTAASVTINPAGDDNSFTLTAVTAGSDGNDITFEIESPSEGAYSLLVSGCEGTGSDGNGLVEFQVPTQVGQKVWIEGGTPNHAKVYKDANRWIIASFNGTNLTTDLYRDLSPGAADVEFPWEVEVWSPIGSSTGIPRVSRPERVTTTGTAISVACAVGISISGTLTRDGASAVTFADMSFNGKTDGHAGFIGPEAGAYTPSCKWVPDADGLGTPGYRLTSPHLMDPAVWYSLEDVASPELVTAWIALGDETGTPVVALVITSTGQEVIDAINADPEASALVTASASGTVTGAVAAVAATNLSGGDNGTVLKIPYTGESGTHNATIYHDSVEMGSQVLEVIDEVVCNREPLTLRHASRPQVIEDFGYRFASSTRRRARDNGTPLEYDVETWTPDATTPVRARMRFFPSPKVATFVEFPVMLVPPRVTDLQSTESLPIPFSFIESIFLPIATKKLRGCPFWRGMGADEEVESDYQNALGLLADGSPKKTTGFRFRTKF